MVEDKDDQHTESYRFLGKKLINVDILFGNIEFFLA